MITVSEALAFYRNNHIREVVDHKRMDVIISHLNLALGGHLLSDIDVSICRGYIELRRGETTIRHGKVTPTSDATIARELGVLKAAANYCLKFKKIKELPSFEIPKDLPKGTIWLFDDELLRLYRAARNYCEETYLFIRLLYLTGSRRAAIEQLDWSQVDFKKRVIYLDKPGAKKTKKRRPTIPMGNDVYNLLLDDWIGSERGSKYYVLARARERYREFMHVAKLAGLETLPDRDGRPSGRITPHCLRHSRATHLLENGMPIYSVAKLLGDTVQTIEKTYGHVSMSKLESELEKYS